MKKAQFAVSFNWIFVLIVGAVILLFFIGLVVRQKGISETKLSATVLDKLDSVFKGASLSEGTINIIEVPQMPISLVCDEDGYSALFVNEVSKDMPNTVVLTPFDIKSSSIVTWTLKVMMPFETENILMLASPGVRFVMVLDSSYLSRHITENMPPLFNVEYVSPEEYISLEHKGETHTRFVFVNTFDIVGSRLPVDFWKEEDVSGVFIAGRGALFLKKGGSLFVPEGDCAVPEDISEDDPFLYAAIFAKDSGFYRCSMNKIISRLSYLAYVFNVRSVNVLSEFERSHPESACSLYLDNELLLRFEEVSKGCRGQDNCLEQISVMAKQIDEKNNFLAENTICPLLY